MKTKDFEDKHFRILLWELQWKGLVVKPRPVNSTIEEEFYTEALEDMVTPFEFKGVPFEITAKRINDHYGCMDCHINEDRGMRPKDLTPKESEA